MELAEDTITTTPNTSNYYNWKRYWLPSNISKPDMDFDDFMSPRAGYFNGDLKTYDDLSNINYLLLVGEPGMGKTKFCGQTKDSLLLNELDQYLFQELKNITDSYSFDNDLIGEVKHKLENTNADVYVFLDGLDEGLLQLNVIDTKFITALKKLKKYNQQLKLRITCRTYDLPKDLENGLKEFYNDGSSESNIYTLCPLTEDDVREAASKNNIDIDRFIEEIKSKELVPLAIRPITLDFLIKPYRDGENLPTEITEIYKQGIERLCKEEHNAFRNLDNVDVKKLDDDVRFLVAARIAYLSIFSNEPNIEKCDIKGINEEWNESPITINDKVIKEVLATQVFSKAGDQISFSHKTYAEFLAAYYIQYNDIGIDALKNLFFNDLGKVYPQLKEVAIWLSRYKEEFLNLIVENDFEILFHKSNIQLDAEAKEKIIDAYIKALGSGEILNDERDNFKILYYEGLDDKIIGEFDKTTHTATIAFLIKLARFCEDKAKLTNPLLKLCFEKEISIRQRSEAVRLLNTIGDNSVTNQFINHLKVKDNFNNNDDYRFKGILLTAVFKQLPLEELLQFLSGDKQVKCTQYSDKGWDELKDYIVGLAESDENKLEQLLLHYSNVGEKEILPYSIDKSLVNIAMQKINKPNIEDILVKFIGTQTILDNNADIKDYIFKSNKTLNLANKQRLLKNLAVFLIDKIEDDLFYVLQYQINAINEEDNSWIFNTIKNEQIEKLKDCWFEFIQYICSYQKCYWYEYANYGIINHFDYLYDAYQQSNHEPFKTYYRPVFEGINLESDEAKYLRESFNKDNKSMVKRNDEDLQRKQKKEKDLKWLKQAVEKVEEGDLSYWDMIMRKYCRFRFGSLKDEIELVLVLKAAKLFFQKVELHCNCSNYNCYDCRYKNDELLYAMHIINNHNEEFLEKQREKSIECILNRTVSWMVNEIIKQDYFHFDPNIWNTLTYLFKLFYDKIPQKTDELIINKFNALCNNDNISKDKLTTLIHQEWDIKSEAINGLLYDLILENNNFKPCINESVFKIIQKLNDESYQPFLKNVNYWIKNIERVKKADFEKLGQVFFVLFASVNSEIDLGEIVDAFAKNVEFEKYFISRYVPGYYKSNPNLFIKSLPKLSKNECTKWFSHLEKIYPENKNSVVYNDSKQAELKNILLKIRVEKYYDFDVIDELNNIKSKFNAKTGSNVIATKIRGYKNFLTQKCWQPLTPKALLEIAKENKRSIETEKQLQELVLEKLKEIQNDFKTDRTHLESLWNKWKDKEGEKQKKPKSEDQISDYVKLLLEPRLINAIANRETKVGKQEGSGWGRVDFSIDLKENGKDIITVLVEAKGDFYSKDVVKPLQKQLKANYSERNPSNHVIYLVYYTGDNRFENFEACQNIFKEEANKQSTNGHHIKSFVLDITFEQKWDKP